MPRADWKKRFIEKRVAIQKATERFELVAKVLAGNSIRSVAEYIDYYNNKRIKAKTKWMPPSKFREASMSAL